MTERQQFKVLRTYENFELREYLPCVIAEVRVSGQLSTSSSSAFSTLFSYISKGNKSSQKIAMTAPVLIEGVNESNLWRITFVMPSKYNVNTLPRPKNSLVKIREIPEKKYAAMTFSGLLGEEKIQNNIQQLQDWIMKKGHQPNGPVELARYNPPWTLPPWRRHEILIELTP